MNSVVLIVLDGFGIAPEGPGNAIHLANPTNINSFLYTFPNTQLKASGEAVGLPASEVGNTEVGHINLGAGKIVYQDLPRINMAIADGSFYKTEAFLKGVEQVKKTGGNLHLIGLVGQGTVHSSVDHLHALLFFAKQQGLTNVFIHAITDGRDSPPKSAMEIIKPLEDKIKQLGVGKIATVMGRYYAMDRDRRWERIERAYVCLTKNEGQFAESAEKAISYGYSKNQTDEFIDPTSITENGKPITSIQEGDTVIFFNYRIDRPRELTKAFVLDDFQKEANKTLSFDPYAAKYDKTNIQTKSPEAFNPPFQRGDKIKNLMFITMTEYEEKLPVTIAFPPNIVNLPLGKLLSDKGISQLRMAETEKERFVGFYFNGHREDVYPKEERVIIPSPKVPTYDQKPEMSAYELTEDLMRKMKQNKHPFILINFANADMVGHTGSIDATIKAINVLDECLGKIVQTAQTTGHYVLITADHGNAEQKINPSTGQISTEHTNNPVPFIAIHSSFQGRLVKLQPGILADIAPTILSLFDVLKPVEMTGRNLLEELR